MTPCNVRGKAMEETVTSILHFLELFPLGEANWQCHKDIQMAQMKGTEAYCQQPAPACQRYD